MSVVLHQHLSSVLQSNVDVAAQAQVELATLKLKHKDELDAKDIAHHHEGLDQEACIRTAGQESAD
jgi:hypothetical protein